MASPQLAGDLTLVLGWVRELSIIGFIIGLSWKARGWYDDAVTFFDRITEHMEKMEEFANVVVTNHLDHIEKDMKRLADAQEQGYHEQ